MWRHKLIGCELSAVWLCKWECRPSSALTHQLAHAPTFAQPIGWLLAAPSPIGSLTPLLVQPIGSLLAAPSSIGSPTPQGSHSRSAASWLLAAPHPQRGCWIGVERVQCECQAHARGSAWTRANLSGIPISDRV